jgi:RES domain-containing protein
MKVYRIAKAEYAGDISGRGAELYGGRWNSPGNKVVYSTSTASLALLETVAWTSMATLLAGGFVLIVLECPEKSIKEIAPSELSKYWNRLEAYPETQKIGDTWIQKADTLLLRVPSAILSMESNVLINPAHTLMSEVKMTETYDLHLDARVLKNME